MLFLLFLVFFFCCFYFDNNNFNCLSHDDAAFHFYNAELSLLLLCFFYYSHDRYVIHAMYTLRMCIIFCTGMPCRSARGSLQRIKVCQYKYFLY